MPRGTGGPSAGVLGEGWKGGAAARLACTPRARSAVLPIRPPCGAGVSMRAERLDTTTVRCVGGCAGFVGCLRAAPQGAARDAGAPI
jgi:hypothetical protein